MNDDRKKARERFCKLFPPLPPDHPLFKRGWIIGGHYPGPGPAEPEGKSDEGKSEEVTPDGETK